MNFIHIIILLVLYAYILFYVTVFFFIMYMFLMIQVSSDFNKDVYIVQKLFKGNVSISFVGTSVRGTNDDSVSSVDWQ